MNRERAIAQYYSTHYSQFMPKSQAQWRWVLERIDANFGDYLDPLPRNSLVADVPCGVGYLEHYLLERGFTNVHGVDLSEEQVRIAQERLSEYAMDWSGKVTFHIGDASDYLQTGVEHDAIAMIDFLEHLTKDQVLEVLDLAFNALKSQGLLLLRVINADSPMWGRFFFHDFTHETPFTPDSLRQCLALCGFEVLKISYETMPRRKGKRLDPFGQMKRAVRHAGLWVLGRFLGVHASAFVENLVAVAVKP